MLYIKEGEKAKTIKELLDILFKLDKWYYSTATTYYDKNFTEIQCEAQRRSFADIYEICQTYFPKVSKEEVAYNLLNEIKTNAFYCTDVSRIVFRRITNDKSNFDSVMCGSYQKSYEDETDYTLHHTHYHVIVKDNFRN